jgi:hypothetical protein
MLLNKQIRSLCTQLLNATTEEESAQFASELQAALHEHVETIRGNLLLSISPEIQDDPAPETAA